jgi:hypothetical protein
LLPDFFLSFLFLVIPRSVSRGIALALAVRTAPVMEAMGEEAAEVVQYLAQQVGGYGLVQVVTVIVAG